MSEGRGLVTHEVTMMVPLLRRWCLIHLRLHVSHRLGHVGEQLCLSSKELLHPSRLWWWWWRLVVLLVLGSLIVVLHVAGVDVATASSLSLNWWLINS